MGDGPAFLDETVPDALDGERIDRALATLVPCSRSEAAEVIGSGGVSIDGTTISKPSTRVGQAASDVVSVVSAASVSSTPSPPPSQAISRESRSVIGTSRPVERTRAPQRIASGAAC